MADLKTQAIKLASAIKQVESGGNYEAKGASGESGAYQFMPATWKAWSLKHLGTPDAPLTPANQNEVAVREIYSLLEKGNDPKKVALIWNGGQPIVKKGVNKLGVAYDSGAYADKVTSTLNRMIDNKPVNNPVNNITPPDVTSTTEVTSAKIPTFASSIDIGRKEGQTDTDLLDLLSSKNTQLQGIISHLRQKAESTGRSDREVLNYLSTKLGGKMPSVESVPLPEVPREPSFLEKTGKVADTVLKYPGMLAQGTGKFLGGTLLNFTNLVASKSKPVEGMETSNKALNEIDVQAVAKAHELLKSGDAEGANRLLKVVQSHGTNITLNDILPDSKQNTVAEIAGAAVQTALEVAPFTKGLGIGGKIIDMATKKVAGTTIGQAAKAAYGVAKTELPIITGGLRGAGQASLYAGPYGASIGMQEEGATVSSVAGSAWDAATNPLVMVLGFGLGAISGALSPERRAIVAKNKVKKIAKAIDKLEDIYIDNASDTKAGANRLEKAKAKTEYKNRAGTEGTDPARTLAEHGVILESEGTKLKTINQANKFRADTEKLYVINREGVKEVGVKVGMQKLSDLEKEALDLANSFDNINSGKAQYLSQTIREEFAGLRKAYGDEVTLAITDSIKAARWKGVKFDSARPLITDSNYLIAKVMQKNIENKAIKVGNAEVAQLNRVIGDRLEAAKFLESLNGNTIKGGRVGKYVFKIIGSSFGKSPLGKILGYFGGDAMSSILMSNSISPITKRRIIAQIQAQEPESYTKMIEWLVKNNLDILENKPLGLPPGPMITPNVGGTPSANYNLPNTGVTLKQSFPTTNKFGQPIDRLGRVIPATIPKGTVVARPGQLALPAKASEGAQQVILLQSPGVLQSQRNIIPAKVSTIKSGVGEAKVPRGVVEN